MGSAGLDIIMSFLWIALSLSSLLLTPSLSSISPILRHIDNNNQEGPHFRSFLVPSSLRSVTTHQVQTIPTSELQKTSLSPKNVLTSYPSLSVPGLSHTHSLENLEILENPQLTRNSLDTFTVELHPEEELARSG